MIRSGLKISGSGDYTKNNMKFALCNEMFGDMPLSDVCSITRKLGYRGIELAPFTLTDSVLTFTDDKRKETRAVIEDQGLEVVGLHWLYAGQTGMHVTSPDHRLWESARNYMDALVDMCADIGGTVLVIGSPKQRDVTKGQTYEDAWGRARDLFASVMGRASDRNIVLCIEPLSPTETNFLNTVEEGIQMVREIDHANFKVHLDVKAMSSEERSIMEIIRSVDVGDIGHFHVNDSNLYGPGMGAVDYGPIAEALHDIGWDRWLSVEVFKYDPDPSEIAEKSIKYLRKFWN